MSMVSHLAKTIVGDLLVSFKTPRIFGAECIRSYCSIPELLLTFNSHI